MPQPLPAGSESYCAWYGEASAADVLYFGQAAFWSAMRAHGDDPAADLMAAGPQPIGRFDLAAERHLAALEVAPEGALARSGVWDVLPHPNGRVYFTTFYEASGAVDPRTGEVARFDALGPGLNELALGPNGDIVASRYGGYGGDPRATGSLVVFSPAGELRMEAPLAAPAGLVVAPKTVAWDARARRYWLATDLVWRDAGQRAPASMHPTIVLDEAGHELERIDDVELQFVRFDASGAGVGAVVAGGELRLVELDERPAGLQLRPGAGRLLDDRFPAELDFVQDMAFGREGELVVTRWSGVVHLVRSEAITRLQLPRSDGLYYAASLTPSGRVCATHCRDHAPGTPRPGIDVVCMTP